LSNEDKALMDIARSCESFKLSINEWKVLYYATNSSTVSRISEQAKLPYSTVIDVIKRLLRNNITMHFVPNLSMLGLKYVFLLFSGPPSPTYPPYTLRVYRLLGKQIYPGVTGSYTGVLGLVPESHIPSYLKNFSCKPEFLVVGDEYKHWTPTGRLTRYDAALGIVVPNPEPLDEVILASMGPIAKWNKKWVDWIDLLIVYFKMKYAYTKLSEIHGSIRKVFGVEPPSRQLMSYHYRTHVSTLWSYNSIGYKLSQTLVPEKVYFFKGPHSKVLARTLTEAPSFYEALYNEEAGVVFSQPPSYIGPFFYTALSRSNVELPVGELLVESSRSLEWLSQEAVRYYKENNEWMDPSLQSERKQVN